MAVGDTGVIDNLDRANGALGANYGALYGTGLVIDTNQAASAGGPQGSYWSAATFGPDCEVFATVATVPATGENVDLMLGIGSPGASWNGYGVEMTEEAGTDTSVIYRADAGVITALGASISQEFANGEGILLNRLSGVLQLYRNAGAGWVAVGTSRSDSTYTGAGYIDWFLDGTAARLDDFGGGTVSAGIISKVMSDTLILTDVALDPVRRVRQMSDTVAVTDETTMWRRLKRVMDETLTIVDSIVKSVILAGSVTYTKVMTDTLAATDAFVLWLRRVRGPIDTITLSDGDTYRYSIVTASDALDASDGFVSWRRLKRIAQDNVDLIDGFSKTLSGAGIVYAKVMSDVAILVDDAGRRWKLRVSQVTDAVGLSDQVLDYLRAVRSLGDVVELSDGTVQIRRAVRTMEESIVVSDDRVSTLYLDQMSNTSFAFGSSGPPFRFGGL